MKQGHKKWDLACKMDMVESESDEDGETDFKEKLVEKEAEKIKMRSSNSLMTSCKNLTRN